jgi:hypothetical protein
VNPITRRAFNHTVARAAADDPETERIMVLCHESSVDRHEVVMTMVEEATDEG